MITSNSCPLYNVGNSGFLNIKKYTSLSKNFSIIIKSKNKIALKFFYLDKFFINISQGYIYQDLSLSHVVMKQRGVENNIDVEVSRSVHWFFIEYLGCFIVFFPWMSKPIYTYLNYYFWHILMCL